MEVGRLLTELLLQLLLDDGTSDELVCRETKDVSGRGEGNKC